MSKSQLTYVALPIGADPQSVDDWQTDNGVTSRLVWSVPDPAAQEIHCDVLVVGSQRLDGSFIIDNPADNPMVYVDGADYTPAQAMILAVSLITAVSLAEKWMIGGAS